MHGTEKDTIGGYNGYINDFKSKNAKITTILFDDQYEVLHFRKEVTEIKNLSNNEYYVRGCTALYDAIGKTIRRLENESLDNKVLFVITTDGLENASKEYDKEKIKELIKSHSDWEFIYLGANIDSYQEGSALGINKSHIANYDKSDKGISNLFKSVSYLSECVLANNCIDEAWKTGLESREN